MASTHGLFLAVQSMTGNPLLDRAMLAAATYLVFFVPLSLLYLWFADRDGKEDALYTFGTAVLSLALSYVAAQLYFHRPPFAFYETIVAAHPENSFPSQHTAVLFGTAFPLLWRGRKQLGSMLLAAAAMTGFARIYIGEHFPVDIAGGIGVALLGLAVVAVMWPRLDDHVAIVADTCQFLEDRARQAVEERAI